MRVVLNFLKTGKGFETISSQASGSINTSKHPSAEITCSTSPTQPGHRKIENSEFSKIQSKVDQSPKY